MLVVLGPATWPTGLDDAELRALIAPYLSLEMICYL